MRRICFLLFFFSIVQYTFAEVRTIHVYVALCDNEHQGIVPVPKSIGNGKDPGNNLYWGALYGVKNFFKKSVDWQFIAFLPSQDPDILERILFKHRTENVFMLAEAYDGEKIKNCIEDFLKSANSQHLLKVKHQELNLDFGGNADLLAYIGHDGLMDFQVAVNYQPQPSERKDVMILACYSKNYFAPEFRKAVANPVLWTTHLMAPEAYTLKAALDGWILKEDPEQIEERAAQVYNRYQKCGITGARKLFTSGF
jgi:hypothetical protein